MPALIVILLIVLSIYSRSAKQAKATKRTASDLTQKQQTAQAVRREKIKEAMEAATKAAQRMADMEKELAHSKDRIAPAPEPAHTQEPVLADLGEGESLSCEHGAVGGSMGFSGGHEGSEERLASAAPLRPAGVVNSAYAPRLTAQEMRRAIVAAEILKRPSERRVGAYYRR